MSADNFERLRSALRDGTGTVELDAEEPHVSGNYAAASEMAASRHKSIKDGERVAFLYGLDRDRKMEAAGVPQWTLQIGVTREQALELLSLGATWVGHEHERPQ